MLEIFMSKQGRNYERVVAEVLKAFDPGAKVSSGIWVKGPDGRRDLDVLVEGIADGKSRKMLVECKDFNPKSTGPVGIPIIDALESKARDLKVDFSVVCSNAGFTSDALRKAKRVGIGLISLFRKGDARIRFSVTEEIYTRKIKVEKLSISLRGGSQINLEGVPFETVKYEGVPVGNWVVNRALMFICANPIVNGSFEASHRLITPLNIELPSGSIAVDSINFQLTISGGWFAHRVTLDSSAGIYDWLRRRVRLTPGPSQIQIQNVDVHAGDPIKCPPDYELKPESFRPG